MTTAVGFNMLISGKSITTNRMTKPSISVLRSSLLQQAEIKMVPRSYTSPNRERRPLKLCVVPPSRPTFDTSSFSPAQTIMQFYSSINEKNLTQLDKLIAEDCLFEDYSFPAPFQGKKEVMHFLKQLTMCMGDCKNMQFNVDHICEGNDYTAAVNWHLDWKNIQVPLTRGCTYYSLSVRDDKLVIKKAQVHVEAPIKLGVLALAIFKIVSSLFDAFPEATERFLKSPHIMFQLLLKAYNIGIKPVISPFLAWYIKLLNFAACTLSITLKILYYLTKYFHK